MVVSEQEQNRRSADRSMRVGRRASSCQKETLAFNVYFNFACWDFSNFAESVSDKVQTLRSVVSTDERRTLQTRVGELYASLLSGELSHSIAQHDRRSAAAIRR